MSENKIKLISVESRKGGVGKTSIALSLARILSKKGKEVIFLDFDLSGTELSLATKALEQRSTWANSFNYVKHKNKNGKNEEINLVDLFELYMTGQIPLGLKWIESNPINQHFTLQYNKINIFSSGLSRSDNEREYVSLKNPSILYDDLHSMWFLEMIKTLLDGARQNLSDEKELVVIIDNSPGYSGMEPVVEDWLTDFGPDRAKFLFVSSSDVQDIIATRESIERVHQVYRDKWDTSRVFSSIYNKDVNIEVDEYPRFRRFFNRLAEDNETKSKQRSKSKKAKIFQDDCLSFYQPSANLGESYCEFPEKYIHLIFNRIPHFISTDFSEYLKTVLIFQDKSFINIVKNANNRKIEFDGVVHSLYVSSTFIDKIKQGAENINNEYHEYVTSLQINQDSFSDAKQNEYFIAINRILLFDEYLYAAYCGIEGDTFFNFIPEDVFLIKNIERFSSIIGGNALVIKRTNIAQTAVKEMAKIAVEAYSRLVSPGLLNELMNHLNIREKGFGFSSENEYSKVLNYIANIFAIQFGIIKLDITDKSIMERAASFLKLHSILLMETIKREKIEGHIVEWLSNIFHRKVDKLNYELVEFYIKELHIQGLTLGSFMEYYSVIYDLQRRITFSERDAEFIKNIVIAKLSDKLSDEKAESYIKKVVFHSTSSKEIDDIIAIVKHIPDSFSVDPLFIVQESVKNIIEVDWEIQK